MPDKQTILPRTSLRSTPDVRAWALEAFDLKLITWRQLTAIALLASKHLPCDAMLVQRTPKSTQYLTCITPAGDFEYRIGPRAEMYGARPI